MALMAATKASATVVAALVAMPMKENLRVKAAKVPGSETFELPAGNHAM